jgi:class 3 adenylate cyclase
VGKAVYLCRDLAEKIAHNRRTRRSRDVGAKGTPSAKDDFSGSPSPVSKECGCGGRRARSAVAHGADYEREFGTAAQVRASLHCGPVVVGEIGSSRRRSRCLGTRSTPRRTWSMPAATATNRVIASADLLDRLVLPPDVAARSLGFIRLRGNEQAIGLCALAHVTPDTRLAAL